MIKNLVLTLALAGLVYCVTPSLAHDNTATAQDTAPHSGPPEHGHGNFDPARRADMLAKHLQLSSDQQAKVLDILKSAQSQMEGLRSDASTPREEKHSKVMEIRKNANDQIRALLDSNQQEKFDQMQSRHQERQGHHGNGQPQGSADSAEQK